MATKVGIVGWGYWGPNISRNLAEFEDVDVAFIVDFSPGRLKLAARRHRGVHTSRFDEDIILNPDIDAVVITTPAATHYEIARRALERGKHVLVAKPLATSVEEAEELSDIAAARGLTLMVDHTFVYTGAVRKMRDMIEEGEIGDLLYIDSVRINLGLVQPDVDVLWDLAAHDISILLHLTGQEPVAVSAIGADPVGAGRASLAHLTCVFDDGLIAHTHVNWLSPVKVRRTLVAGSRQMIVYDDVEPTEKVRVYDSGVDIDGNTAMIDYRAGDVWAPKLDIREALALECEQFLLCLETGLAPERAGAAQGIAVVRVLEAAQRSLAAESVRIAL